MINITRYRGFTSTGLNVIFIFVLALTYSLALTLTRSLTFSITASGDFSFRTFMTLITMIILLF